MNGRLKTVELFSGIGGFRLALDGRIGMSFALQWRYNFGRVFGADDILL